MTMANQKIQYTENMVGQNHPTLSDTLNRCLVGVNNFRLVKSAGNLTLVAVNGNLVDINGNIYAVTSLPTLSPSGLDADTLYYIYLYDNGGTATLEASATAYTADSVGRQIKTGDGTRRLMGIAATVAGPAWSDTASVRYVLSYDNRRAIDASAAFTSDRTSANTNYAEIQSEIRVSFLAWPDEAVTLTASGVAKLSTTDNIYTAIAIDSDSAPYASHSGHTSADTSYVGSIGHGFPATLTLGAHYATLLGAVASGTGTWIGAASATSPRCSLHVTLRG